MNRIETKVNSGAVKLHIFEPSGRKLWTVVGKDNEHWTDLDLEFCSCKNYYYKTLSNFGTCYHLKSVQQAKAKNEYVSIIFDDSEYVGFVSALLSDNATKLLCS